MEPAQLVSFTFVKIMNVWFISMHIPFTYFYHIRSIVVHYFLLIIRIWTYWAVSMRTGPREHSVEDRLGVRIADTWLNSV